MKAATAQPNVMRKCLLSHCLTKRPTFRSWTSFHDFASDVRRGQRFVHSPSTCAFLATVLASSDSRSDVIPAGTQLYRAQLGGHRDTNRRGGLVSETAVNGPHPAERMKPRSDRAAEGRANPTDIPCLYVATDADTAIAEVRPWPGQYVSLGLFVAPRDIRIVDCSRDIAPEEGFVSQPSPAIREAAVWRDINHAFAQPMSADDGSSDYVPTQVLAELFRANRFEGVVYKSSVGPGRNGAIFNLLLADLVRCTLCTVDEVSFAWRWTAAIYCTALGQATPLDSA